MQHPLQCVWYVMYVRVATTAQQIASRIRHLLHMTSPGSSAGLGPAEEELRRADIGPSRSEPHHHTCVKLNLCTFTQPQARDVRCKSKGQLVIPMLPQSVLVGCHVPSAVGQAAWCWDWVQGASH